MSERPNDRVRWQDYALLFAFALVLGATGADAPLQDVDEPRFAASSRAMLAADGDWIVPHFNGAERLHKPILTYWVQAAAMRFLGQTEYVVRLPSAASVALAAVCTAMLGQRLGLRRWPAILAGAVLCTCVQTQVMAHAATADALLLACTTVTALAQVHRAVVGARPWTFVVLWAGVAATFLTKGPAGVVGPAALAAGLWASGFRPRPRSVLAGALLALALVAAWGVPALIRSEGRFFTEGVMRHVVSRSLEAFEGHGGYAPWWYAFYFAIVPVMFLPWSALLGHVVAAMRPRARLPVACASIVLRWWTLGVVSVFTVVTSKLPHYVLPAYPALAIALLASLQEGLRASSRSERVLLRATGVLLLLAPAVALVVVGAPRAGAAGLAAGACLAGGCFLAARHLHRQRRLAAVAVMVVGAAGGFGLLFGRVVREWAPDIVQERVAVDLAPLRQPGVSVAAWRLNMPSLVWSLDRRVDFIVGTAESSGEASVCAAIDKPGHVVVTDVRYVGGLLTWLEQAALDPTMTLRVRERLAHPVLRCRGFNPGRGRVTELVVLGTLGDQR